MGSSPKPPDPPDYEALIRQQDLVNRPNTYNPWGSTTHSQDAFGRTEVTQSLNPQYQAMLDRRNNMAMAEPASFDYQRPDFSGMQNQFAERIGGGFKPGGSSYNPSMPYAVPVPKPPGEEDEGGRGFKPPPPPPGPTGPEPGKKPPYDRRPPIGRERRKMAEADPNMPGGMPPEGAQQPRPSQRPRINPEVARMLALALEREPGR